MNDERRRPCYGCKHLRSKADGAGGGTYYCARVSGEHRAGLVIGSYGHWTDDSDEPREIEAGCYE